MCYRGRRCLPSTALPRSGLVLCEPFRHQPSYDGLMIGFVYWLISKNLNKVNIKQGCFDQWIRSGFWQERRLVLSRSEGEIEVKICYLYKYAKLLNTIKS